MNTKLYNALKQLPLTKEQKEELVNAIEETAGGNKNNVYYLYNHSENGQVNWYDKDYKLLFSTQDRMIQFIDIDDTIFENYFNCSVNDFHNIYDKIIVTDLNNDQTFILNKCATSFEGYYGIFYICGMYIPDVPMPSSMFLIDRTTDATNYIRVMGSFTT